MPTINEHQHPWDKDTDSIKKIYVVQWSGNSHNKPRNVLHHGKHYNARSICFKIMEQIQQIDVQSVYGVLYFYIPSSFVAGKNITFIQNLYTVDSMIRCTGEKPYWKWIFCPNLYQSDMRLHNFADCPVCNCPQKHVSQYTVLFYTIQSCYFQMLLSQLIKLFLYAMHSNHWQVFSHFLKTFSKQNHKVNRGNCTRPFN